MRGLVVECGACAPSDSFRRPRPRLPPSRAGRSLDPADPPAHPCTEPLVYHTVTIHPDPRHIHLMVTRRAAGVLPVDRLVLTDDAPPDAS
jgi:hypothetical protein